MRALLLALILLTAAPASAQRAPVEPDGLAIAVMGASGLAASIGTLSLSSDGQEWVVLAAPLVSGAVVHGVGEMLGYDGGLLETMGGAALGGFAGASVIFLSVSGTNDDGNLGNEIAGVLIGVGLYAVLPPIGATMGYAYSARPTVLRTPDGDLVPSATLRLSL